MSRGPVADLVAHDPGPLFPPSTMISREGLPITEAAVGLPHCGILATI